MKINTSSDHFLIKKSDFKDLFNIMKICLFLLFAFAFQLMATNTNAQDAIIELRSNSVTVSQLISEIEKQTDYLVVYSNREVNTSRTVSLKNKSDKVSEYLNQTFSGTDIGYDFEKNYIILAKRDSENKALEVLSTKVTQQTGKTVTGKVVDVNGGPVIGATIVVQGDETKGTVTDVDGNYVLTNVPENAILDITYVGMQPQNIQTNGRTSVNITLLEDTELLDEVVVIGYGTMRKKDLTGSIASVDGETLASRKTTQLSTALQGALPGVMVTNPPNTPEGASTIRIRGITTIGNSDPLYIVDGIPSNLSQVNPNDVESISVLKDAASAAIYGSRAAAGVILVTTKRAKENTFNINYSYEYGWNKLLTLPSYVNTQQYAEMINELRHNDNPKGGQFPVYTEDEVNNWLDYSKTDPDHYANTNWADVLLRNRSPQQTHSISISAGAKKIRTNASFNSQQIDGFYEGRSYKRYLLRVNNDMEINKFISASIDFNVRRIESEAPNFNPVNEINFVPYVPVLFSDGRYGTTAASVDNRYNMLKEGGTYKEKLLLAEGRASINITPFEGLKISGIFHTAYDNNKYKTLKKAVTYTYLDDPNTIAGWISGWQTTKLTESRNDFLKNTVQFLANYTKTFKRNDLDLTAGYENYNSFDEYLGASRDRYEFDKYPYLNLGPLTYRDNSGYASEYAYRSYFGRIKYSYADKYLLQFNFRSDGSSRFKPNYRWGYFPSISAGWIISEENFLKNSSVNWLSFLKLRASWGALGNERLSSVYPSTGLIDFNSALLYQNGMATSVLSAAQTKYTIESLSWEKTESYDMGIDANFFNNRLRFSGDYYKKATKDMLLSLEIPDYIGYNNPEQNTGKMYTTGWDISLAWNDRIKDFNYGINLNVSDFVSTMGDLGGTEFLGDQIKIQGSEFNEWYGYLSDGLFLTQEDLVNSPKLNNNIKVGDVKYKDISGPDGVPDGKINSAYDRVLLGGSLPRYTYGATVNIGYKNWDASVVIQGIGSQNVRFPMSLLWNTGKNFSEYSIGKYWSPKKSDEENAKAKFPRLTEANQGSNNTMSDYWMMNGRYFRLKNLMVGYTLPLNRRISKSYIESFRIYFSGNNLFSIDKYPKGIDPESITKTILLGISANF